MDPDNDTVNGTRTTPFLLRGFDRNSWLKTLSSAVRWHLTEPWTVSTSSWASQQPLKTLRTNAARTHRQEVETDTESVWQKESRIPGYQERIILRPDEVVLKRDLVGSFRFIYLIALALAPIQLLMDPASAAMGYIVLSVLLPNLPGGLSIDPAAKMFARSRTIVPGLCMILGLVGVWLTLRAEIGILMLDVAVASAIIVQLLLMYLENGIPGTETNITVTMLYVPLFGALQSILFLALFFVFVWGLGASYLIGDAWDGFFLANFNQTRASLLADLTGVSFGWEQGISREMVLAAFLQMVTSFFPLAVAALVVIYLFRFKTAWDLEKRMRRTRLTEFTGHSRAIVLGGTIIANGIVLAALAIAINIIVFGILGRSLVPTDVYAPIAQLYTSGTTASGDRFLQGIYSGLDFLFQEQTVLPPRGFSLLLVAIFLFPFILMFSRGALQIITRPFSVGKLLFNSRPVTEPTGAELDGIEVRVIDRDGLVEVRPLSLFFGSRKYIIITEAVEAKVKTEQLAAILYHEAFHLQNRNHPILAGFLAIAIGGRNAALAFHDYPKMEREADLYAAKQLGDPTTVTMAIDRMVELADDTDVMATIGSTEPGFINVIPVNISESLLSGWERRQISKTQLQNTVTMLYKQISLRFELISGAPERVFYGGVLADAAHLAPEPRKRYVLEAYANQQAEN